MKTILSVLYVTLTLPAIAISLFITYSLLQYVEADRLLWFLYWMMVPVTVVGVMLQSVIKKLEE